jgi:sugar (pentulose or hexulose) kinase
VLALGSGAEAGGGLSLTLGTSIVLAAGSAVPFLSSLFRTPISARPGLHYLLESVFQSGTHLLRWFLKTFPEVGEAELGDLELSIGKIRPGCDGLIAVPDW